MSILISKADAGARRPKRAFTCLEARPNMCNFQTAKAHVIARSWTDTSELASLRCCSINCQHIDGAISPLGFALPVTRAAITLVPSGTEQHASTHLAPRFRSPSILEAPYILLIEL